jgi:hypothetical protein
VLLPEGTGQAELREDQVARRLIAVLVAAAAVLAVVIVAPSTAGAGTGLRYRVVDADNAHDGGVYYRNSAHWNDTKRIPGVGGYYGEVVELVCGAWGDAVGPYANRRWHLVVNISRPSAGRGWLPDRYLNTPNAANQRTPGEPECGAAPSIPSPTYNRSAAVNWALAHAKDPQAYGAMCTWFVSNALWAGGFQRTATWTSQGHYGSAPGTKAAWWLPTFLSYFRANNSTTTTDITPAFRTNAVPQAQPGDLILYDWGNGEGISHVAFVVDIAPGQYPEVAEMGQYALNPIQAGINMAVHIRSSYVKRGWTWSAVRQEWLQKKYPHVKAYLLHINGGYLISSY